MVVYVLVYIEIHWLDIYFEEQTCIGWQTTDIWDWSPKTGTFIEKSLVVGLFDALLYCFV